MKLNLEDIRNLFIKIYNLDYYKFEKILEELLMSKPTEDYLAEKWNKFQQNPMKFLLNHPDFMKIMLNQI